jgi:hypothetical protein
MESSPIVTGDEKRQLILAHAAAREGRPERWGLGYYVAVAASCLMIVTGWSLTFSSALRSQIPSESDSILTTLRVNWEKYDDALRASRRSLQEGIKTLSATEQTVREEALKTAAARINVQATSTNDIK